MSNYKPYTLIGARATPEGILKLMTDVAYTLCLKGYTGRSGAAVGADTCLEEGYERYSNEFGSAPELIEIYLPWQGFNNRFSDATKSCYVLNNTEATAIAEEIHPAWDRCSRGARALHTRNVHQILGINLDSPSKFVICWAEPRGTNGDVKGGTGTAVRLGMSHGCTIFNLYYPDVQERMRNFVNKGG